MNLTTYHLGMLLTMIALASGTGFAQLKLPVTSGQLISVGNGYAPEQSEPLARCVQGRLVVAGETKANYGLDEPAIDAELNPLLFPPLSLLSFGSESRPSPVDYIAGLLPGRRTIRLSYFVAIGGRTAHLAEPSLNALGQRLKVSAPEQERLATCGDLYVGQVELGGYLAITVNIAFLSSIDRQNALESGVFRHTGIDELADALEVLGERYKGKVKISLDVSQVGGDTAAFYVMVQGLSDNGWLSCAYPDIDRCAEGIHAIYSYGTDPDGLYAQFSRPIAGGDLTSFAIRRASLIPMNTISPGFTRPLPDYGGELSELDALIAKVIGKSARLASLNAWRDRGDSRLRARGYAELSTALERNLANLEEAVTQCRQDISHCGKAVIAAKERQIEEPMAGAFFPKSFMDVCLAEEQSVNDRKIFEALAQDREIGACHDLLVATKARLAIDLGGLGLQEVSLLYQFDQWQRLELGHNSLTELVAADYWPDLTLLDLAHNRLRRVALGPSTPMAKLYLEGNALIHIDGLSFPKGMSYWTVFDNPLEDIEKTRVTLKEHSKHLIVTPLDLCALHGKKLLPMDFFTEDQLGEQLGLGNGPDYATIAGTTRFKGWRPCIQIYSNYPRI